MLVPTPACQWFGSMRILLPFLMAMLTAVAARAQVGGCVSHFAENYNPAATFNDGSCDYNLQQLLNDGFELGDLLSSGVEPDELVGLFGAGGFIVDIDVPQDRVLVAWPHTSQEMLDYNDDWTAGLRTYMVFEKEYGAGLFDGAENQAKIKRSFSYRYEGGNQGNYGGYHSDWQTLGCENWFIPTEEALLLYKSVCQGKYAGNGYSTVKDFNPDAGVDNRTLHACGGNYPFGNRWIWTSEPTNVSEEWNNDYVRFKMVNLGGVTSITHGTGSRGGNENGDVFPMGISEIRTVGTINNCNDWSYNGSPNYASQFNVACNYPFFNCESFTNPWWDQIVSGLYPGGRTLLDLGTDEVRPLQLKLPATRQLDGNVYDVAYFEIDSISGIPPGLTLNYGVGDQLEGGMVHCLEWTGAAVLGGRYELRISGTYFVPILGDLYPYPTGETYTHDFGVVEFQYYDPPGSTNNGGCTYPGADNYDPQANADDGSCTFQNLCPGDFNGDDLIGVQDVLYLLGLYNTTCE